MNQTGIEEREVDIVMERIHNNIGEISRRISPVLSSGIDKCESTETKNLRCDLLGKLFRIDEELKDLISKIDI